jgi:Rrf2 family nitric oxide-sensitive transcriptional repressor
MALSLHTDYALRTLMFLAARKRRASVAEIARFYAISRDHLAKVAQRLARAGYVRSLRGVGGGLELAASPESLRLGDVIRSLEGELHLLDCVAIDNVCVIQPGCHLRQVLAEAERLQREYLNSVTLSDVTVSAPALVPLST